MAWFQSGTAECTGSGKCKTIGVPSGRWWRLFSHSVSRCRYCRRVSLNAAIPIRCILLASRRTILLKYFLGIIGWARVCPRFIIQMQTRKEVIVRTIGEPWNIVCLRHSTPSESRRRLRSLEVIYISSEFSLANSVCIPNTLMGGVGLMS